MSACPYYIKYNYYIIGYTHTFIFVFRSYTLVISFQKYYYYYIVILLHNCNSCKHRKLRARKAHVHNYNYSYSTPTNTHVNREVMMIFFFENEYDQIRWWGCLDKRCSIHIGDSENTFVVFEYKLNMNVYEL